MKCQGATNLDSRENNKTQALLCKNKQKRFNSLDVYKLGAFLHRLALCPFIGCPHLRHLACFRFVVLGASIAVWLLGCKTSCS